MDFQPVEFRKRSLEAPSNNFSEGRHPSLKRAQLEGGLEDYSERPEKVVIARSEATWQSHEIASVRPEHYAVQGFVRNDT